MAEPVYDQNADKENTPLTGKDLQNREKDVPDAEALKSGADKIAGNELLNEREINAYKKDLGIRGEDKNTRDDINDQLNKGYTGRDGEKKTKTSKRFNSKSKLKQRIAIAGAAAGGSVALSIFLFLALLPLKLEHIVSNLQN